MVHDLKCSVPPPIPAIVFAECFHGLTGSFRGNLPTSPPFAGANVAVNFGKLLKLIFGVTMGLEKTGKPSFAASALTNGASEEGAGT